MCSQLSLPDYANVPPAKMCDYMRKLFAIGSQCDGRVLRADLAGLLTKSGFQFPSVLVKGILQAVDHNGDGIISVDQYREAAEFIQTQNPFDIEQQVHRDMLSINPETQSPRCLTWVLKRRQEVRAAKQRSGRSDSSIAESCKLRVNMGAELAANPLNVIEAAVLKLTPLPPGSSDEDESEPSSTSEGRHILRTKSMRQKEIQFVSPGTPSLPGCPWKQTSHDDQEVYTLHPKIHRAADPEIAGDMFTRNGNGLTSLQLERSLSVLSSGAGAA